MAVMLTSVVVVTSVMRGIAVTRKGARDLKEVPSYPVGSAMKQPRSHSHQN